MKRSLRREIRVRCSQRHAFEVFSTKIDLWWPPSHRRYERSELRLEPSVGGRFYERAESGEEHALGEVLAWEPPDRLAYTWWPGAVDGPTRVEVRFAADGEHTRVEVIHREADTTAWDERVAMFERSWTTVLGAFEGFVDRDA
ncbi:MAG: SRPBCC domain-containing protein [Myxococcales bacterium]|nr:SRPBCC domain-containing protein [Myxococcales bacterium]